MNRWKRAAILCAILAATGTPVFSGLDRNTVTAETAAIRVNKHFPANMAAGVSPDTPLTVEFAGAVNQSFYQTVNLNLFNGTDPIDGELFYNPSARQIMFKSKQPLKEGHTYTAQLSYHDGLGRTSEKVWSFQTNGSDQFQPMPSTQQSSVEPAQPTNPANYLNIANASMGSGKITGDSPLEVTFTEPLDIVSLKSAPVKLFENNQPVGIDYKLSRDLKTLTISPRNGLKANVAYAVAVDLNLAATSGERLHKKTLIPFKLATNEDQPMVAAHEITESPAPANNAYANPFAEQNQAPTRQVQHPTQARRQNTVAQTAPAAPVSEPVQLIGLAPVNGARVTNLTQPVTIGFSEEIRPETLNEFTFRLEDDFGPVPAKIHYFKGHKQATLTPVGLLDSNKNYRVVVTQGITDLAGRPIRSGINSMFSTTSPVSSPAMPEMMANNQPAPAPEEETAEIENFDHAPVRQPVAQQQRQAPVRENLVERRPVQTMAGAAPADRRVRTMVQDKPAALKSFKVTAIYPGADNQNVSRKSKIAVHFSEPADPKTVDSINISVFGNQTRVDGKVVYDRRKNRAIFEPSSPLDANTEYKVIVSDKIKSRMGEPLSSQFSWQFATAENIRHHYNPRKTAEADAAFYIPLVDSKLKKEPGHHAANLKTGNNTGAAFNFVDPKHWSFKSVRHISNKGILNSFPFVYTDNVTRYEFATAINSALSNLKTMQHMSNRPKLKVADMVELQKLIVEFRTELRSCAVNTTWFETFLARQGVNLQQIEARVKKLSQS